MPNNQGNHTADVIIIGGGVQGTSLAYHLATRGVKVVVLEKEFVGAGATGRSSGLVRMHYDTKVDAQLAWLSFQYFRNWKECIEGECGFTRTGFIQIVEEYHTEALITNVAMLHDIGIPTFLITASDVKRLAPYFQVNDIQLAAYEPESGYAMPSDTANSLMTAARRHRAVLVQDCQVQAIKTTGSKIAGVTTNKGYFSSPIVVNAAGAWAWAINQMVGLDLPIDTWRHDTMFVIRPDTIGISHPAVIDFPNEMYFRSEGKLTLVGLEDSNPLGESPNRNINQAEPGFVNRAIERLCQRIPIMEQGGFHSAHGGYDGITPDQHPMIGLAGPEGFFLNCGHSGTGFKTAPAVGLCLAELIIDGVATSVDITSLEPGRFANGKMLKGNYHNIWR